MCDLNVHSYIRVAEDNTHAVISGVQLVLSCRIFYVIGVVIIKSSNTSLYDIKAEQGLQGPC